MAHYFYRVERIHWILHRREDRIRADVPATSSFGALASELCSGCSASANASPDLVVHLAGRISRALGGAIAEPCSAFDDFMLVRE